MRHFFKQHKYLLCGLLLALLLAGTTMAYLKATDGKVTNTFSWADVSVKIVEDAGGSESSKIVRVQNTGKSPVFVRAVVEVSAGVTQVVYTNAEPGSKADDTIYVVLGSGWTQADGYYYYTDLLAGGATTTPIVNGVYCGANVDADSFDVLVYGESVLGSGAYSLSAAQSAFAEIG